jgi:uncharacterized membrane protein
MEQGTGTDIVPTKLLLLVVVVVLLLLLSFSGRSGLRVIIVSFIMNHVIMQMLIRSLGISYLRC